MSIVADRVRRLDAQIDRISLSTLQAPAASPAGDEAELEEQGQDAQEAFAAVASSRRVQELLQIAKSLSPSSSSGRPLQAGRIRNLILQSGLATESRSLDHVVKTSYESEIEWLVVGKATVQTYGLILESLLDGIIPLSDEIWFWDDVLSSYHGSILYSIQTSPLRWWTMAKDIYDTSLVRLQRMARNQNLADISPADAHIRDAEILDRPRDGIHQPIRPSISPYWRQFYAIVRGSIADRSIADLGRRALGPVARCRARARQKQARLRKFREMTATRLGMLMDESLIFGLSEEGEEWKGNLRRTLALMDTVVRNCQILDISTPEFEDSVFAAVDEDTELMANDKEVKLVDRPPVLARRVLELLEKELRYHNEAMLQITRENGKPSVLIRYWVPALALFVSSSTIMRILVNRREDMVNWVRDLGSTVRDFWFNWVVEPTRQIVGTIRHDSSSEIAIMSRDSLKADGESLERMVADFASDRPDISVGASSISAAQLSEIRIKVKEGDLTPVLKAYERDLRRPFVGTVRGDLVRALLIQVQKTKVDLEMAMSGIDALLKSQQLVFAFLGLTPGVMVSIGMVQYVWTILGSRKGLRRGQRARRYVRVLRKIDKVLCEATPSEHGTMSYKDHGLLICEMHVLRSLSRGLLPTEVEREFVEDLDELASLKGLKLQRLALNRILWAYAEWLGRVG